MQNAIFSISFFTLPKSSSAMSNSTEKVGTVEHGFVSNCKWILKRPFNNNNNNKKRTNKKEKKKKKRTNKKEKKKKKLANHKHNHNPTFTNTHWFLLVHF